MAPYALNELEYAAPRRKIKLKLKKRLHISNLCLVYGTLVAISRVPALVFVVEIRIGDLKNGA